MQLEDLGFCEKGKGGAFVADGNLISGTGKLPFNTDGGGLCNNHPANRGGLTKVLEAVRQLRGEAHPEVQVKNCDLALAHGTGGSLGLRHGSADRHSGEGVVRWPRARTASCRRRPPSQETQAYWDAAAQGKLLVRKCTGCGEAHHYPRTICPFCFSDKTEWIECVGQGHDLLLQRDAPRAGALRASPT